MAGTATAGATTFDEALRARVTGAATSEAAATRVLAAAFAGSFGVAALLTALEPVAVSGSGGRLGPDLGTPPLARTPGAARRAATAEAAGATRAGAAVRTGVDARAAGVVAAAGRAAVWLAAAGGGAAAAADRDAAAGRDTAAAARDAAAGRDTAAADPEVGGSAARRAVVRFFATSGTGDGTTRSVGGPLGSGASGGR